MKLAVIEGNSQKLDGGAMFGNAAKAIWSRWVDVDSSNCVHLATRGLFVEFDDGLKVLFEAGIGAFFSPDMKERYGVQETEHVLLESLKAIDLHHNDIDVVVLSHMHFDHAGGLLSAWSENQQPELLFPNARYLVSRPHWQRTIEPHVRDRASFIPALTELLKQSGRLELVDSNQKTILEGRVSVHFSDGHTPGLMLSEIETESGPMVFSSDLIPGSAWVHLPISMGYDRFPEQLIDEKKALLDDLSQRNGSLYFTHDLNMPCGLIEQSDKGRYSVSPKDLV